MKKNRRSFLKKSTALAAVTMFGTGASQCRMSERKDGGEADKSNKNAQKDVVWPIKEGPGLPYLCMGISRRATTDKMRQLKQLGINNVQMGGGRIPWKAEELRELQNRFKEEGLTIVNMMISGFRNVILGREGRDEEIEKVKESLIAAGEVGIPVVEYNFYVDRLMDGYYEKEGRGGAGITAFKVPEKDPLPKPENGIIDAETLWENLSYFLKAVIPVAEKAGVRMALHPNDPPVPVSHGSAQIITTFNEWKRLIDLVDSPSNGMTFDCGVTREIGEDPVEVFRYLMSKDRVNHIHYRNVIVKVPHLDYAEVFYDEGQVNMFAVMKEILYQGYQFAINPEHPRALDYDREHPNGIGTWSYYPGGGGYTGDAFDVGYTRAMMQAVLSM